MRHNENLALYLFGVIALAALFVGQAWAMNGLLIMIGGVVLAMAWEGARGLQGMRGKRKRKDNYFS